MINFRLYSSENDRPMAIVTDPDDLEFLVTVIDAARCDAVIASTHDVALCVYASTHDVALCVYEDNDPEPVAVQLERGLQELLARYNALITDQRARLNRLIDSAQELDAVICALL